MAANFRGLLAITAFRLSFHRNRITQKRFRLEIMHSASYFLFIPLKYSRIVTRIDQEARTVSFRKTSEALSFRHKTSPAALANMSR